MKNKIKQILFPIHPLSNIDIEEYFRINKINGLVRPRDKMPSTLKPNSCIIINLEEMGQSGSHWVCAVNSKKENKILFYDSYGVEFAPQEFLDMNHKKKIVANNSQHQKIGSVLCGYYCLKICKSILKDKMSYLDTMKQFSDTPSENNADMADNL